MQIEIYADIVFILNFIMDLIILSIVNIIIKNKTSHKRIVLGAFIGAILYCIFIFIPCIRRYYNIFSILLLSFIPLIICFNIKTILEFIRILFIFYAVSFSIGGAGMALFYYTNIGGLIGNRLIYQIKDFPFTMLIISTSISYILIRITFLIIRNKLKIDNILYTIEIYIDNRHIEIDALLDTGNQLYEPVSNMPVMVIEYSSIKSCLPKEISDIFLKNKENDIDYLVNIIAEYSSLYKIRLIPFKSLGNNNGMLLGIKPDSIFIKKDGKDYEFKNIIIGIYNSKLSKTGNYQGLINSDIVNYS